MRLPALTEAQRTARDYIHARRGAAAELLEHARRTLVDLKYEARVQQDRLLSAGDTRQLETVLAQAERTLARCEEAMPALQAFEERFAMAETFERLMRDFLAEGETPESLFFADNYERMTWLADRVLLFARHLTETLLPWLRNAIDEINQAMIDRARQEDEAPARVEEARRQLAALQAEHPHLQFRHSEGLLAEADRFLKAMVEARAQNYHRGVAESARQAIEYAEGALTMAEEALGFAADPEGASENARAAIESARASLEATGRPVPESLRRAAALLEQARAAAHGPNPDWPNALLLYNQASAAFADATAASEE